MLGNQVAVVLTVGLPPHIEIDGDDALEPFGRLAETTYGPAALMLQYRPIREGTFQPYVGAGACYMIIFSADDGAFRDVEIADDLAPALEIGTRPEERRGGKGCVSTCKLRGSPYHKKKQ